MPGALFFGDRLAGTTIVGAVIILVATVWVARREGRVAAAA